MAAVKQIALVKLAARKNEDPALYQILQEIQTRVNDYMLSRPSGKATLVNGLATVAEETTQLDSVILLNFETPSGTIGTLSAPAANRVPSKSFQIQSSSVTDASTVVWQLVNI